MRQNTFDITMRLRDPKGDDEAAAPKAGSIISQSQPPTKPRMPPPHNRPEPGQQQRECSEEVEPLTAHDVLSTLGEQYTAARCTLFETARLRRPFFLSWGNVELSDDERNLDSALSQAVEDLECANRAMRNMCSNNVAWGDDGCQAGAGFKAELGKLPTSLVYLSAPIIFPSVVSCNTPQTPGSCVGRSTSNGCVY